MIRYRWWRWMLSSILGLLVACWVLPVQAGGWATVTAEVWPAPFVAGEPYTIPLVVRQHGVHAVRVDGNVRVVLRSPLDGDEQTVTAQATEVDGRYRLDLTFAAPGAWTVEVQPGGFPPTELVAQVMAPSQPDVPAPARGWWSAILALFGWGQPQAMTATPAPAEVGQLLFGAKGCVTCHLHADVAATWSTEMGPNLTEYGADPAWLARWLANPASERPQTQMPNLDLAPDEIASLSAFLLAE